MYALRLILGVTFIAAQGAALTWAAFAAPVHAKAALEGGKHVQVITRECAANADTKVFAETRNGAIEVRSWDKAEVRITVTKTMQVSSGGWALFGGGKPFKNDEEAAAYFEKLKVEFADEDPAAVKVKAVFPEYKRNIHLSVSYIIDAPAAATLGLETENGEITLRRRATGVRI